MELNELQNVMLSYLRSNQLFNKILPFSGKATMMYGVLNLIFGLPFIYNIILFSKIRSFIWIFWGIIFMISILGLIISFARNDMLSIMILFGSLSISYLLGAVGEITSGYMSMWYMIQQLIYTVIYAYLAYIAMVRYNKTGGKVS